MSGSLLRAGVLLCWLTGLGASGLAQSPAVFPFQLPWDDGSKTPTDLSYLNERPAGAAGVIRVGDDGHLYAGDRRIRFVGVNFTNRACIPEHADAEKISRRLAKFGINVVRFHMLDADWGTPVIFDPSAAGTRSLNPEGLDRLDYFVARLKENGIYVNLNLLTGRNFTSRDGVNPAIDGMDWKAKQTPAMFDPTMIELQKEYASELLGHVNPYTDLAYTEDPAVAFVEIVNEHGLIHAWHAGLIDDLPTFFADELQGAWNDFLKTRYGTEANLEESWKPAEGETIGLFPDENLEESTVRIFSSRAESRTPQALRDWCEFLWRTEETYWMQMRRHLKEALGVRALLIGTVVGTSTPNLMSLFDVIDTHAYWQHPSFESGWGSPWWIRNESMVADGQAGTIPGLALKRIYRKPFSVSEYNHPFPNSFGSESFLFLAAYGALQDWDAIYGYTYSDGSLNWSENRQTGYFDLHRNPGKMIGLFHAACLFRRADIQAAHQLVVGRLSSQDELSRLPSASAWTLLDGRDAGIPPLAALLHATALQVDGTPTPEKAVSSDAVEIPDDRRFEADTGEIWWDSPLRVLRYNSLGSRGVIGYVVGQSYELGEFEIEPKTSLQGWAAIYLSRLRPQGSSRRFIISTHGLVQNHGQQWNSYPGGEAAGFPPPSNADLTLGDWGTAPVEVEGITCDIRLPYSPDMLEVYSLDATGARQTQIPVEPDSDGCRFRLSPEFGTLWYEVAITEFDSQKAILGFGSNPDDFVGIALMNPADRNVHIRLVFHSADPVATPELVSDTSLPPGSQLARLLPEWFETTAQDDPGWIEVLSDESRISALAQFGNSRLGHLDGMTAGGGTSAPALLTRIHEGPQHFRGLPVRTRISVANLSEEPAQVQLILKSTTNVNGPVGRLSETRRMTLKLNAKGSRRGTTRELFGTDVRDGCVEVIPLSSAPIAAGEVVELTSRDTIFALNGMTPIGASQLYAPQIASLPGRLFSSIRLINVGAVNRMVTLKILGDLGQTLAPPVTVEIPADGVFQQDAESLFQTQFGIKTDLVGSLVVEVPEGDGILGDVVFGLNDLSCAAGAQLQGHGYHQAVLGQVANLPGLFFTGLALFNSSLDPAFVRVEVRDANGDLTGSVDRSLPGWGRMAELIADLIPTSDRQVGGYIRLQADQAIVAQELLGTTFLSLLSAVPANDWN